MSPDPLATLADNLRARRDAIFARLRAMSEADPDIPEVQRLSDQDFLDHLPPMLDRLDAALRAEGEGRDAEADRLAEEHGEQRRRLGYRVDQVLREMGSLHAALLTETEAFFGAHRDAPLSAAVAAARRIGDFIMREAARSADSFSRAEARVQGRARMRTVLAQLPLGVILVDADARVIQVNGAARALTGTAAAIGASARGLARLTEPSSHHAVPWEKTPLARALRGETVADFEADAVRPDGARRRCLFNAAPLRDEDGRVSGAVAVLQDISDRIRAEEVLREADRSKDRFLALLSHEMRNPVASILNAAYLLQQDTSAPRRRQAQSVIERNARNISRLMEDLLDVSRIVQGKVDLDRRPVRLDQVARDATADLEPRAREKGLSLTAHLDEAVWVSGDAMRLEQIVSNLLGNAIKFTDAGAVAVSVTREGDFAVLTVTDTGVGAEDGGMEGLFDTFAQGEPSGARATRGLGLGLALVRSFTEMHGGTVTAERRETGPGTVFTVRLPLGGTADEAEQPTAPEPEREGPCRVLLVEDDRDAREILRDILEMDGYQVSDAADAQAALDAAARLRPDVILLDIGLPGVDGYELARRLRADPGLTGARLIAITGYGQPADRERARESGFDAHLTKPVDLPSLRELLAGLCVGTSEG